MSTRTTRSNQTVALQIIHDASAYKTRTYTLEMTATALLLAVTPGVVRVINGGIAMCGRVFRGGVGDTHRRDTRLWCVRAGRWVGRSLAHATN